MSAVNASRQMGRRPRRDQSEDMRGPAPAATTSVSDRVLPRKLLDRDPPQFSEFLERGTAAEAPEAAGLHAAERHLRLVVDGRVVDVTDTALDPLCKLESGRHVFAEDRGAESVFG